MNAKVTELMDKIGISRQSAIEIVAMDINASRAESRRIPCEVYSRCVGYIRPLSQWNNGKREEFRERKTYKVKDIS